MTRFPRPSGSDLSREPSRSSSGNGGSRVFFSSDAAYSDHRPRWLMVSLWTLVGLGIYLAAPLPLIQ